MGVVIFDILFYEGLGIYIMKNVFLTWLIAISSITIMAPVFANEYSEASQYEKEGYYEAYEQCSELADEEVSKASNDSTWQDQLDTCMKEKGFHETTGE